MSSPYVVEFVSADGESTFQIEERVNPTRTKLWPDRYETHQDANLAIYCKGIIDWVLFQQQRRVQNDHNSTSPISTVRR